jgi:hypothetical protein
MRGRGFSKKALDERWIFLGHLHETLWSLPPYTLAVVNGVFCHCAWGLHFFFFLHVKDESDIEPLKRDISFLVFQNSVFQMQLVPLRRGHGDPVASREKPDRQGGTVPVEFS